jgi:group I intron endonuclease
VNFIAYKIVCLANGKCYIGVTRRSIKARWSDHLEAAATGRRHRLAAAMRKYGIDQFEIQQIACALTIDALYDLERELIAQEGTMIPAGYNMSVGGDGPKGLTHSAESRAKMSVSASGKKQSAETIAKRVLKLRGKKLPPRSPEWCADHSLQMKGRKWTEPQREKIEGQLKGRIFTPEWKAKLSAAKKGRRQSPEICRARSANLKGVKKPPRTAEHCAKLAANAKSRWARLRAADPAAMRLT